MGLFDWLRPKPRSRVSTAIARELAEVVFALHPQAADKVVLAIDGGVVVSMEVPTTEPDRDGSDVAGDRAEQVARITAIVGELSSAAPPTAGDSVTVMRDRVIWMPSVVTFSPPVP